MGQGRSERTGGLCVVGKPDVTLEWYARHLPGPSQPVFLGAATHKLYLVLDNPVEPWLAETPWIEALEVACQWAAGAHTKDRATELVTKGLNGTPILSYTPSTIFGFGSYQLSSFLNMLKAGAPFQLNCTDCADAVTTLANLLGCELFEGRMLNLNTHKILGIGGNAAVESDWYAWNWGYHEVVWQTIGPNEPIWDGCLQLDLDTNYGDTVHIPHLAIKMKFSDYKAKLVDTGPCTLENVPRRRALT